MALPPVRVLVSVLVACGVVLTGWVGASTAARTTTTTKVASPVVTSVAPLDVRVGERLTIRGRHFIPGRRKNIVVFKRDGQRAIFVKADRSTRRQIVVVVPDRLVRFLAQKDGAAQPTRFRVRVLSRRLARRFTPLDRSPKIAPAPTPPAPPAPPPVPPDCDKDGTPDDVDLDDDNDRLSDSAEAGYGTDRCKADTDDDGMRDVFEVESALDLNLRANFYPGKAPYPNPLYAGDAKTDFDQDGLPASVEHDLWSRAGGGVPLAYSDGDQDTTTDASTSTARTVATQHLDRDGDLRISDDEKDFDGDRLGNWVELSGPMLGEWWSKAYPDERPYFGHPEASQLLDVAAVAAIPGRAAMYADADVDGDGVPDGADDQDHDGYSNEQELARTRVYDTDGDGTLERGPAVNPYNPCLPNPKSRTCSLHPPLEDAWAPFDGTTGSLHPEHGEHLFPAWVAP